MIYCVKIVLFFDLMPFLILCLFILFRISISRNLLNLNQTNMSIWVSSFSFSDWFSYQRVSARFSLSSAHSL